MSNVNVTINKIEEIITIMNETIKELVKKKGKPFLFALFLFCTLFMWKNVQRIVNQYNPKL